MTNLSKIQKDFLKFLINYKSDTLKIQLLDVFEKFFKKKYSNLESKITAKGIYFYKVSGRETDNKDISNYKDDIISILLLIKRCISNEYITSYEYEFILKKYEPENFLLDIKIGTGVEVFESLHSNFILSPFLKDYIKKNFKTNEQIANLLNFGIAIFASFISTIVAFFGFFVDYDIANNISTTVVFKNDKQFEKLISSKQVNVKSENNIIIPESLYKPKTELKLEIFK